MVVPTPANPADRLGPLKDGSTEKHRGDLYVRTSWIDAALALNQLEKGRVNGGAWALWIRARLQRRLESLGEDLHAHAGKVLFVALLLLSTFCVGLKSAQLQSRVDQLWVQEGGRLEAELRYTRRVLGGHNDGGSSGDMPSTHQLTIQAPSDPSINVLSVKAVLAHEKALRIATSVTVQMFDISWRLRDICAVSGMMNFDYEAIDNIFRLFMPCNIITPLDCFWEGSSLHGPDYPVTIPNRGTGINWTNLNPIQLVQETKGMDYKFSFSSLEGNMKRAGITTAYQEKPCLDPKNPLCPETAPNKISQQPPDVAAELSGGCYGIAAKYMHWPEELIVGGGIHNKSGGLRWARALQTVVQLMTDREFYDYLADDYKVKDVGWSREKAAMVLDAWQRKFSEEIHKIGQVDKDEKTYEFFAFSTATLNDILGKFTQLSIPKIAIGYACILVYVAFSLVQWKDSVKSQAGVGIAGVLLLCMTVIAGLGFCSILGIPFNASTMQIVPFLALGLGVDDMFLLTHAYAESPCGDREGCSSKTPAVLRTTGLSVLLTSLCNVCAFFAAALIPIPALRVFSLQAAILLLFNMCAMLFVYPAMISADMRRRAARRSDLLCCLGPGAPCGPRLGPKIPAAGKLLPPKKVQAVTRALPPDRLHTVTSVVEKDGWRDSSKEPLDPEANTHCEDGEPPICISLSLTRFAKNHYAPFLMKPAIKVLSMLTLIIILIASVWGATKVTDGLQLTDIVPQGTDEHKFLSLQGKYFGFYNMYAVTQGDFEYPTNQKLLYDYHESFVRIPHIMKNDNGGLPDFWLTLFRDWLMDLQKAFDRDFEAGYITQEKWYTNASDEAVLAYKLLVQTGYVDNPIDKTLITHTRLVDSEGIINPKAFYNYLSAWASNDASAYMASQANMKPEPKEYIHLKTDFELKIPKSPPLVYTQLPFYLHGLSDTEAMKNLITSVRNLCTKFEAKGLANFPSGIPFTFWEQYLHLRPNLMMALACALGAIFIVVGLLLLNIWAAILVVITLAAMVLQLLGTMALLGINLSAIPAVLLIVAVGIGVHFTVHICLSFITSIGGRDRRTRLALEHMFAPVTHGAVTSLLAVVMLAMSDFNFVTRYFFCILLALIAIGFVNGLVFFPVLLSLVGPAAEVIPLEHPDRISTPSPKCSPVRTRRSSGPIPPPPHHSRQRPSSLTTITEEPGSHSHSSLQSIVVQPEVVVETTTYNTDTNSNSGRSTPTNKTTVGGITTKVTATANIKVEVHTPVSSERCHSRRSYYSRDCDRNRDRDRDRDRDSYDRDYYDRDYRDCSRDVRDRDRDSRERDRDNRDRDKDRRKERDSDRTYRESRRERDRIERDRDRDRYRDRDNHRENGRDSGHESDVSRH